MNWEVECVIQIYIKNYLKFILSFSGKSKKMRKIRLFRKNYKGE